MTGTLSIYGLYQYDDSIFDGLTLPEGMNKEALVNTLLIECAGMEVLYPNPEFMKNAISIWSSKNQAKWEKLYKTTLYEYDPLNNKKEDYKEVETRDLAGTTSSNTSSTSNSNQNSTTSGKAFNDTTFIDTDLTEVNDESSSSYLASGTSTDAGTITRTRTYSGNNGSKTFQELIEAQRQIDEFDIYDIIILDFKKKFTLMIY